MPRIKKTKTSTTGVTTQSQKGKKKARSPTTSVAEMLQTLNATASDTSSQPSSGPATRPAGRGRKKANESGGSVGASRTTATGRKQTAIRGGRGRGKKGGRTSERTDASRDDSQQDQRTERGSGIKRKQKMTNEDHQESSTVTSSPGKRQRRTGQRKALDDDDFLERQISAQSVAKWQSLSKSSQEFLHQVIDGAISVVLTETSDSNYDGVQDHLNNLKRRLMTTFVSLKVPNKRQPNYRDMENQTQVLEAALVETSNQVECLDKEVQLQQQLLDQKEEDVEALEATDQEGSQDNQLAMTKRLHPLLQEDRHDILGLPPLRGQRKDPSPNQFDDVRSACQQPVLESLRHWSQTQGKGAAKITEFIDALTAVQASLPK